MLDCSSCSNIIGFQHILQFIKDVVQGLDIGPDRVRVGTLPYYDKPFSSFDITAYVDKRSVLQAICEYRYIVGWTRFDFGVYH